MAAFPPESTGGSIAAALDRPRPPGKPPRIRPIGAGQMGTDILVQTEQMAGIEVVAAADAIPENVFAACKIAGSGGRVPELADDLAAAGRSVSRGRLAVCKSYREVCASQDVDVV